MIKVYSTNSCPWCVKAKEYLKSMNVDFVDADVSNDLDARKEMFEISGQGGVPVLNINGTVVVGFDKNAIDGALGI